MKYKGLLFDLDGVIVDTAKYHYMAWKQIADELGIKFTEEDNERLKGVSRVRSFEIILEIGNVTMSEDLQEFYREKKNQIYVEYISNLGKEEILPGVREFLETSKQQGYKIALGSASKNSMIILERLGLVDLFDAIIDGTKVSKAKPDPEVFLRGAKELGLHPGECIVFEDSVAGIKAARSGGMKAVGIGKEEVLPGADYYMLGFDGVTVDRIG